MNIILIRKTFINAALISGLVVLATLTACAPTNRLNPGPDREAGGGLQGALTGAGAGAVTAFHATAPTGPGAFIGAGFGAVAGAITGAAQDRNELEILRMKRDTDRLQHRAAVQQVLEKYFEKRLKLHPTRDIYPADIFFDHDSSKLSKRGTELARELARLNKERLPWSRLVVASYVKSTDENSEYAKYLSSKRAVVLGDAFVRFGIEPRRIETRPVVTKGVVVVDPDTSPLRYAQAIELIAADR